MLAGGASAGCGSQAPASDRPVGVRGEGALNLAAPPGWVEDGSNDPGVDWVHPFQAQTGCKVTVRSTDVHAEVAALLRSQGGRLYDGALVPGDVAGLLVAGGDVAPVDVRTLPDWDGLLPGLQAREVLAGHHYGVPAAYAPTMLLYDTAMVGTPAPSWSLVWGGHASVGGRLTASDSPTELADAAVFLMARDPSLGITDPFELTEAQLDAAVGLAQTRATAIAAYWTGPSDQILDYESGAVAAGDGTGLALDALRRRPGNTFEGTIPSEGSTGWVASWMTSARARHPVCMAAWIRWTMTAGVQAAMARWNVVLPANAASCTLLRRLAGEASGQDAFDRCGDSAFLASLHLWTTPRADCGDGRRDCMPYDEWAARWAAVRDGRESLP